MQKIRGTKDVLDFKNLKILINKISEILNNSSFSEVQVPILESAKLFQRTLGISTDIVSKEMFMVKNIHESDVEDLICLRPEATTSIMRAFIENNIQNSPWKVFTIGQMFRHERPQKGRYREFTQISIESINAKSYFYDFEMVLLIKNICDFFNFSDYKIGISYIGTAEERKKYSETLISFFEKLPSGKMRDEILEISKKNVFRVLDSKNTEIREVISVLPLIYDSFDDESKLEWDKIKKLFENSNIKNYEIDPFIIRGLDYYNGFVFEFTSTLLGSQSAFCGGGRYDSLSKAIGEKNNVPSVGCAIGLERLYLILSEQNLIKSENKKLISVISSDEKFNEYAFNVVNELRLKNYFVDCYFDKNSIKNGMKKANSDGADYAFIIGEEEFNLNSVTIKNMKTSEQIICKINEINFN